MRGRDLFLFFTVVALVLIALTTQGCDWEDVAEGSKKGARGVKILQPFVPAPYQPIAIAVYGLLNLIPPLIYGLKKRKDARNMKEAILTKADQIDDLLARTEAHNPPETPDIRAFMKADKAVAKGTKKKALQRFDNIRKDLV